MKVVFRTDSSLEIGTGHVMRCLTLAHQLQDKGAAVEFVCRPLPGNIINLIEKSGFTVLRLRALNHKPDGDQTENIYTQWLGISQERDAQETSDVLGRGSLEAYDWLVVDHYGIDSTWETPMREIADRIMVIDDLANRDHDCDLLLDQNLFRDAEARYTGRVPDTCVALLGPRYALLRPEFVRNRKLAIIRNSKVKRTLVFFGGVDRTGRPPRLAGRSRPCLPDQAILTSSWAKPTRAKKRSARGAIFIRISLFISRPPKWPN